MLLFLEQMRWGGGSVEENYCLGSQGCSMDRPFPASSLLRLSSCLGTHSVLPAYRPPKLQNFSSFLEDISKYPDICSEHPQESSGSGDTRAAMSCGTRAVAGAGVEPSGAEFRSHHRVAGCSRGVGCAHPSKVQGEGSWSGKKSGAFGFFLLVKSCCHG